MNISETALQFRCGDATLVGILSAPEQAPRRGVLIVVGGPQYRAGSHRQFTLLARHLAHGGAAAMRFDYRGMGDSDGVARSFDSVGEDLRAAVDRMMTAIPSLDSLVIWGLCDGACAALFYAAEDSRVEGQVLVNPWILTEAGQARTQLKHYYLARLLSPDLWRKILGGRFAFGTALRSFARVVARARASNAVSLAANDGLGANRFTEHSMLSAPLPQRMRESLQRFEGRILLITSGRDLTAKEFLDTVAASKEWRRMLRSPRISRHDLEPADHTFSRRAWRDQVACWTSDWLLSW